MGKLYWLGFSFVIIGIWIFKTYVPDSFWGNNWFLTIGIVYALGAIFVGSSLSFFEEFFPKSTITKFVKKVEDWIGYGIRPDKKTKKLTLIVFILIVMTLLSVVAFLPKKTITEGVTQIETGDEAISYKYIISYKEVNFYTAKPMPWHKSWAEEVIGEENEKEK